MAFGQLPINCRDLAQNLVSAVTNRVSAQALTTEWTDAVKDVLLQMGTAKGFTVSPNRREGQGEYLLDMLWQKKAPCADIVLAVESEWGSKGEVLEDFEKLMHIKTPLKLMVFSTSHHEARSGEILEDIETLYMEKFSQHVQGEEYLLVEFVASEKAAYCYHFSVPRDGQLDSVSFKELPRLSFGW